MIRPLRRFVLGGARLYRVYLRTPVDRVVIFRRGRGLEKAEAPEYRPLRRRHNKPFANRLGMGVERNSGRVRR